MTCATINGELKRLNIPVKMYKGKGYYYFMAQGNSILNVPSLYTVTLKHWTIEQVVEHIKKHIC